MQRPKTKHWWLLIWTSLAAKFKSQGPWLHCQSSWCWAERQHFNKTSAAKWNPWRILLHINWTKSCTAAFLSICQEKFDKSQPTLALIPHPNFIQSSFLLLVPVFFWMELTLVEGAIRMEQCYGAPYGHFMEPHWYFIDAWNNATVQPKQPIWKAQEKLKLFQMLARTATLVATANNFLTDLIVCIYIYPSFHAVFLTETYQPQSTYKLQEKK